MQSVSYTKTLAFGRLSAVTALAALLCVGVLMPLFDVGPALLGWMVLAFGGFSGIRLARIMLDPTWYETRIVADAQTISIHLPGKETNLTPVERISGLRGFLGQLPGFDKSALREAQDAALSGEVPLWGKRYVLLQRSDVKYESH